MTFKEFNKNYKHLYLLFYYFFINFLYTIYNELIRPKYIMHASLDDFIPFVKIMVLPYIVWYLYISVFLIYFAFKSVDDFYNLCFFLFTGMTICFIIYALFPNGQDLRPTIIDTDIFSRLIKNIYMVDKPTNSNPSMHVLNSIAVHSVVINSKLFKTNYRIKTISLTLMTLIITSTVMIKQHSIIDVISAILLSNIIYLLIYKLDIVKKLKENKSNFYN